MLDVLVYAIVLFLAGFVPVFFFLVKKKVDIFSNIIFSVAFAPVLIAIINSFNVLLNIEREIFQYILPALLLSAIPFFKPIKFYSKADIYRTVIPVCSGILFGITYWYLFFFKFYESGSIYTDVVWNLGLVGEFKYHFPAKYPHWDSDGIFLYHYLSNMGFAGISNLASLNVIDTVVKCGQLSTAISVFVILAVMIRKNITENIILMFLLFFFPLTTQWFVFNSLKLHVTGAAGSTYFWSMPLLFCAIYFIQLQQKKRFSNDHNYALFADSMVYFIILFATGFSKISNLLVLCGIEFAYFIIFLKKRRIYTISMFMRHKKELYSFLIIPFFSLIVFIIFSFANSYPIIPGIEIRDFKDFGSWNLFSPVFAMYGVLFFFILLGWKAGFHFRMEFLICSILNFALFLLTRHVGGSDVYFAFNAVVCNLMLIIGSTHERAIRTYIFAYLISGLIVIVLTDLGLLKGFNPFEFNINKIRSVDDTRYNFRTSEVNELLKFSEILPKNALIAIPDQKEDETFIYSAFIGRRIWNEDSRYSPNVMSYWSLTSEFLKSQKFIPDFIKESPRTEDFEEAYARFIKDQSKEIKFNETEVQRFSIYKRCAFEQIDSIECNNIVRTNGWTHILVNENERMNINEWLKSKKSIKGNFFSIFCVSN